MHFLDFVQPLHKGEPHATKPFDYAEAGIAKLLTLLEAHVDRARERGLETPGEMQAKRLAERLVGGAGLAHRAVNVDNALPPLRLVM